MVGWLFHQTHYLIENESEPGTLVIYCIVLFYTSFVCHAASLGQRY